MANRLFLELTETASECSEDDSMFDSDGDTSDEEDFWGVPIWRTSVNISKGIIGEGLLSLPFGLAAGTGIFSGILIAIAFYAVMVYTFWTLGRVCEATGEKTHRGVGHRLTGGDIFGTLMTATNQVKTLFTCTAYALVIGKNAQDILAPLNWNSWISSRQGSWVTILFFVLVPLCLLRDLGKLAWTSFLGLVCETGVVAFMLLRFLDGSYQPGGTFYASQAPQTRADWGSSGEAELWTLSAASLTLVSAMSTAFLAHYNAPKFYHQLHRRSPRRFLVASSVSFTLALLLFVTCMVVGYLTFGTACSGNILHNYSDKDPLANAARLGMLVAVVCGFPIAFTGLRDASFSLCGCGSRRRVWVAMTLALLTLIGALGWSLDNLGILNSLGGAILGSMITLIFPGLLLTQASSFEQQKEEKETKQHFWRVEGRVVGRLLTLAGVLLMIFGTTTVVLEKFLHRKV